MDTAIQIIGLLIIAAGAIGFVATIASIVKWHREHPRTRKSG